MPRGSNINLPSLAGLGTYIQIEDCSQRYSSAISPPVTAALQAEADGNIGTQDSGPAGVHWEIREQQTSIFSNSTVDNKKTFHVSTSTYKYKLQSASKTSYETTG
jgi:hypothetical protein